MGAAEFVDLSLGKAASMRGSEMLGKRDCRRVMGMDYCYRSRRTGKVSKDRVGYSSWLE